MARPEGEIMTAGSYFGGDPFAPDPMHTGLVDRNGVRTPAARREWIEQHYIELQDQVDDAVSERRMHRRAGRAALAELEQLYRHALDRVSQSERQLADAAATEREHAIEVLAGRVAMVAGAVTELADPLADTRTLAADFELARSSARRLRADIDGMLDQVNVERTQLGESRWDAQYRRVLDARTRLATEATALAGLAGPVDQAIRRAAAVGDGEQVERERAVAMSEVLSRRVRPPTR
jgi:hypothetical protein